MDTNDEIEWKDCWKKPVKVQYKEITETIEIETREGKLYGYADKDVLLKGVKGEIYPCKIDIFNATYTTLEPLSEEQIRADTAKQIFKELDEAVWEQIEPSRLEEFYEQFSNAKDLKASLNVATAFSIIGLDAEKYEALKKQFNIED